MFYTQNENKLLHKIIPRLEPCFSFVCSVLKRLVLLQFSTAYFIFECITLTYSHSLQIIGVHDRALEVLDLREVSL